MPRPSITRMAIALIVALVASTVSAQRAAPSDARGGRSGPTLAFGGDVIYDAPLAYQLRRRSREVGRAAALEEVFSDLAPTLSRADLALVNLEGPVSPRYRGRDAVEDMAVFAAPEDFLEALMAAGVDAADVANNHAYDQGPRGLDHTIDAASQRSLHLIGVGDDAEQAARARVIEVGGARIAVAGWTEGSNHRPRHDDGMMPRVAFLRDGTIEASLRAARRDAHFVIACFHWTSEDEVRPRPMMREVARRAAEAGADLVIGHGTHVPGSSEEITTSDGRRVRVLYSLGNLLAAMDEPAGVLESEEVGVRDAPIVTVRTRWRGGRLDLAGLEVTPHWISRPVARAPWMEGGQLAVSRPVELRAELERLASADCGTECESRADQYRRRVALIDEAMEELTDAPLVSVTEAPVVDAPVSGGAVRDDALDEARGASEPRARRRPRASGSAARATIRDDDPRLAPFLRGVTLDVTFGAGSAQESSVDEGALARLAALMREDRTLSAEIVGYATRDEAIAQPTLGASRARRVKGLVAMRGPSRSRFRTRGGAPGSGRDTAHVTLRLSR